MALHKHLVDKALGEFQPACLILKREKRSALCRDLTNLTFGQQVRQARESAFREAHGQFELKVAFEDVGVVLPFPKGFAINQAPQPGPMAEDRDGIIAAVQNFFRERFLGEWLDDPAAHGNIEGAVVAVKARVLQSHLRKMVKIFRVGQAAFAAGVRRDDRYATLQRPIEGSRIREFGPDDLQGVFAAGMGQQRQAAFRHALPEPGEPAVGTIDVLAVRQTFHHDGAARCRLNFVLSLQIVFQFHRFDQSQRGDFVTEVFDVGGKVHFFSHIFRPFQSMPPEAWRTRVIVWD